MPGSVRKPIAALRATLVASAAVAATVLPSMAAADAEEPCQQAKEIIANFRKIVTPNGVEEQLEIPVGGTKQWITVRGRDRANPILLLIHGGPASPEMPISWAFQSGWEDYFTVVQWDQRGSGKSYNSNDPEKIRPTLSLERIVADAAEVIGFLRKRYGKERVFVLGHSWGSLVGLNLAYQYPQLLHAYVGMGQVINGPKAERVGYEWVLRVAEKDGNAQALEELRAIAPYPEKDGSVPLEKIDVQRKWSVYYGGLTVGRKDLDFYYDVGQLSPDYTQADFKAIGKGSQLSLGPLLPNLWRDYTHMKRFQTPIVMFEGRHDYTTPSEVVAEWFAEVEAPVKKFVWFEHSAHMMPVEEPGRLLVHLVQDVLPLAGIEHRSSR
jgi:pimeloyl-ACP methyl ester carboxylesterase